VPEPGIRPADVSDLVPLGLIFGPFLGRLYRDRFALPGTVLLAEINNRPVGAMFVSGGRPAEAEIVRHLGRVAMLHRLVVTANRRRTGIGSRLVGYAENALHRRGHRLLAVGVDPHNTVALQFYRRLGYREWAHGPLETVREHGAGDGVIEVSPDECLVFVKELTGRPSGESAEMSAGVADLQAGR
jgi:GNAT superfamily N-acetyltransferase